MAIRLVVLFLECSLVQLLEAKGANEMFWMEFTVHGCDTSTCNWFLATVAERSTSGMIMHLAIWHSFMFKETSTLEGLMAFLQIKQLINQLIYQPIAQLYSEIDFLVHVPSHECFKERSKSTKS